MPSYLEEFQLQDFSQDYRLNNLYKAIPRCGGEVLDVGTGNGYIFTFLNKHFSKINLSDNSDRLLEHLRKKYKNNKKVSVLKLDSSNFDVSRKVELITSCDVIEHLENDKPALDAYYRNLKEGGMLFLSVPAISLLYGIRDKNLGHYRRYSKKLLRSNLEKAGFKKIRIRYWNLIGVLPYFVSEKIFNKELKGVARFNLTNAFLLTLNRLLSFELFLETKTQHLPLGLTLIATAEK